MSKATSYRVPFYVEVEADSPEEAHDLATQAFDGGEFLFEGEFEGLLSTCIGNVDDLEHVDADGNTITTP